MHIRRGTLLLLAALCLASGAAQAVVISVPGDQPTIAAAIDAADLGDVIEISNGTYYEHDLVLKRSLTVRSVSGIPGNVIIDAEGLGRVFTATSIAGTRLEGLVITGGSAPGGGDMGGGILAVLAPLTITDCIFVGNTADEGGALGISNGAWVTLESCVFTRNTAISRGGAIVCWNTNATLGGSTFSDNTAPNSSGIYAYGSSFPMLDRLLIVGGNVGDSVSFASDSIGTVSSCNFWGNAGGDWDGNLFSFFFQPDNISEDPQFCSSIPDDQSNWGIQSDSPCAPANSYAGDLIGAAEVRCAVTPIQPASWGEVKALYR